MLGLNLAFVGLTGSVIVFYREIDVALNPALHRATPAAAPLAAADILRRAAAGAPHPVEYLMAPDPVDPVWTALGTVDGHLWTTMLDPGTGSVLGSRDLERSLSIMIYRLHSNLMLQAFWGEEFVGMLGGMLLASAASGIYLWWPKGRRVGPAMVRLRTRPRQILYLDLHNLVGIWMSIVLLVVAFSGVVFVFPGLLRPVVSLFSPVRPDPAPSAPVRDAPFRISADMAVTIALAGNPGAIVTGIAVAHPSGKPWAVVFHGAGSNTAVRGTGEIWIDPWSGAVLADRSPRTMTAGERLMSAQLWLHNGALLGWPGRLAVFASGLALPGLATTGTLLWLRKRKLRRSLPR